MKVLVSGTTDSQDALGWGRGCHGKFHVMLLWPIFEVIKEYMGHDDERTLGIYLKCVCCGDNSLYNPISMGKEVDVSHWNEGQEAREREQKFKSDYESGKLVLVSLFPHSSGDWLIHKVPAVTQWWDPTFTMENCYKSVDEFKDDLRKTIDEALAR